VSAIGLLSTVRGVAAIRPEGVKPTCHGSSIDAIDPERTSWPVRRVLRARLDQRARMFNRRAKSIGSFT
jgi:hypothetical protein